LSSQILKVTHTFYVDSFIFYTKYYLVTSFKIIRITLPKTYTKQYRCLTKDTTIRVKRVNIDFCYLCKAVCILISLHKFDGLSEEFFSYRLLGQL